MALRITSNATKVGYVVTAYLIALLVVLAIVLTVGLPAAATAWGILLVLSVGIAARSFRGEGEAREAPRAWWRMSMRPTSSIVFAVVFLLQGAWLIVSSLAAGIPAQNATSFLALAIVNLVIGTLFVHSAVRLTRRS